MTAGLLIGRFYTWWRGDPLPDLPDPGTLGVEPLHDAQRASALTDMPPADADRRMRAGHRLYVASLDGQPAAHGWCATREGDIAVLGIVFVLPPEDRYLWDFVTRPHLRGRRLYPLLLQAILRQETAATRFWIGHDQDNVASGRGIARAGFQLVGDGYLRATPPPGLQPRGPLDRVQAAGALFGMPLLPD
jgi:hypothetical protein